ncbi:uncharacterized protein LOC131252700 [Magnolia sinica]|uniref:uncharacterized protein LOC131252700 n=1 Tax=Magnolia sinica TaxID=86752 RepID=UPI0026587D39|nr:uncharacterized protein LOC131252700 [Magnolia sinica]
MFLWGKTTNTRSSSASPSLYLLVLQRHLALLQHLLLIPDRSSLVSTPIPEFCTCGRPIVNLSLALPTLSTSIFKMLRPFFGSNKIIMGLISLPCMDLLFKDTLVRCEPFDTYISYMHLASSPSNKNDATSPASCLRWIEC